MGPLNGSRHARRAHFCAFLDTCACLDAWQGPASPARTPIDSRACSAAASLQTARIPKASGHRVLFRTQGGERSGPSDRAARGRRATTDGESRRHAHLETTHPRSSIFGRTSVPKGTAKEKGPRTAAVVCGMGPATHNSAGDSADEGVGPVIGGSGHPASQRRGRGPPCNGAWPWGGWEPKKPKGAVCVSQRQCSLLCCGFSFGGHKPFTRLHRNTTPTQTHARDPGRWTTGFLEGPQDQGASISDRATAKSKGPGIRPKAKARVRGRGCVVGVIPPRPLGPPIGS